MTPQEKQLVDELFDRLATLENSPRDDAADRAIAEGLRRAPHAAYALVQTALVQDEALKRANARIEELQAQLDGAGAPEPEPRPASFLDSMREAFGGRPARGSVPSVRPGAPSPAGPQPQNYHAQGAPPQPPYPYPPQMAAAGSGPGPGFGGGGSFFGSAVSTAAGLVGGALLLDGIRSMFGHSFGGAHAAPFAAPFGNSPWGASGADTKLGSAGGVDAAQQIDDGGSFADDKLAQAGGIDAGGQINDGADDPAQADDASFQTADDDNLSDNSDFGDDGSFGGDSYDV